MFLSIDNPDVRELPASAQLVYLVISQAGEPVTYDDLDEATGLTKRAIREQCRSLVHTDAVERAPCPTDGRKTAFGPADSGDQSITDEHRAESRRPPRPGAAGRAQD